MSGSACRCPDRSLATHGKLCLLRAESDLTERRFRGAGYNDPTEDHRNRRREGAVSDVGSRLLINVANRTTMTGQLAEALAGLHGVEGAA